MNSKIKEKSFSKVYSRYVRISPEKIRRIANQIKGLSVFDSLLILRFLTQKKVSGFLLKLLSSAYNNLIRFSEVDKASVFVYNVKVDDGPFFKRVQPHAQGRGFPIKKRTCHITIELFVEG